MKPAFPRRSLFLPALLIALGCACSSLLHAADPVPPQISNLRVNQRASTMFVDIWYDLIDPDSDQLWVGLELSADGGTTYSLPANALTGDVGVVAPGRGKHIEWNAWNDWAGNFTTRGRARITVNDTKNAVFPPPFPAPRSALIWIPPGTFPMGSPANEQDRYTDEGPQTRVYISRGFFLDKFETRQWDYELLTGANPSSFRGDGNLPVETVSWSEAVAYCQKLTDYERTNGRVPSGWVYSLPTEAQWEYACRAGTTTRFSFGNDPSYTGLGNYAWYSGNSGSATHLIGTRLPNAWGLHDMYGNVWEWCSDWYGTYPGGSVTDWKGPASGSYRVSRGGGWSLTGQYCRSAQRIYLDPGNRYYYLGFRVALVQFP